MFLTYPGRELRHQRRQTVIVASGLALAIALVTVGTSVPTGVGNAPLKKPMSLVPSFVALELLEASDVDRNLTRRR